MQRGVVLIGVARTGGGLPELQAVKSALDDIETWARSCQQLPADRVRRLSDEHGPVTAADVKAAVRELADAGDVEQLVVYFSGHGVNIGYNEFWLLSDAPDDAGAAVNVRGSAVLAEYCGFRHVVLISDACRSAAAGVIGQAMTGQAIFPNRGRGDSSTPVDVFYACTLGHPALEVAAPGAATYTAIYTQVLVDALHGDPPDLVEVAAGTPDEGFVWPVRLKKYLAGAVTGRLHAAGVPLTTFQTPDARVSADGAWLSRLSLPLRDVHHDGTAPHVVEGPLVSASRELVTASLAAGTPGSAPAPAPVAAPAHDLLVRSVDAVRAGPAEPDDLDHALVVHGRRVVRAASPHGPATIDGDGATVRVTGDARLVVLEFDDGTCAMLPAPPGFVAGVLFDDDELLDVSYQPARSSWLRDAYEEKAAQLTDLRAVIASASKYGVFRLDDRSAAQLARQMHVARSLDLSLALYAGYAYDRLGDRERLQRLRLALAAHEPGIVWFDLDVLAQGRPLPDEVVVPLVPALSQGWAEATAVGAGDAALLATLQPLREPSLWTLFDRSAYPILETAMRKNPWS
jgi:caspase domain-containing protein